MTRGTGTARSGMMETAIVVVQALAIAMVVRVFFYQPFNIPSGSMKETLLIGDYLFVSKLSYGYSRFSFPFAFKLFPGRVLAAEGQKIGKCNAELLFGIPTQVLLDKGGSKAVKTGGHRRVRGEEIAGSCDCQRDFKGPSCLFHEVAGTFEYGEGRVSLIQVTDLRLDSERSEQSPPSDPEQEFLLEAQLRSASIEFAGNPPMNREVRRVIAV